MITQASACCISVSLAHQWQRLQTERPGQRRRGLRALAATEQLEQLHNSNEIESENKRAHVVQAPRVRWFSQASLSLLSQLRSAMV